MISTRFIGGGLVQAYLETEYRVHGEPPVLLKIGEVSAALAGLHQAHGVHSSAFITAWNPFSRRLSDEENRARQATLELETRTQGWETLAGIGEHPSNQWKGEASVLVLGVSRTHAEAIGMRYEQNAIVWCGSDAMPELVLLR